MSTQRVWYRATGNRVIADENCVLISIDLIVKTHLIYISNHFYYNLYQFLIYLLKLAPDKNQLIKNNIFGIWL